MPKADSPTGKHDEDTMGVSTWRFIRPSRYIGGKPPGVCLEKLEAVEENVDEITLSTDPIVESPEPATEAVTVDETIDPEKTGAVQAAEQIFAALAQLVESDQIPEPKPDHRNETPMVRARRLIDAAKSQIKGNLLWPQEIVRFEEDLAHAEEAFKSGQFRRAYELARGVNDTAFKLKAESREEFKRINARAKELVEVYARFGITVSQTEIFHCLRWGGPVGERAVKLLVEYEGYDPYSAVRDARGRR